MNRALPRPQLLRWQPLRAGLVDVFYYDEEEFWFRDGRLLLRGNNGTGKSKVLALMLPFLLDGDISAHRVEPDADPKKRMEWNLLLGGAHPHSERIGYTWLEFGRRDDNGDEHYFTIGCGMKAVAGKGIAAHWYFTTSARVGGELRLIDPHGSPLSRDRLGEALDGNGHRFEKARDYRRAIDEALFSFGDQRYGALVDLLIQLRQPQLSKRPSEKALSAALTESLPPLDQAILADVAEAFRSLQEDRDELADMHEALRGARGFLGHYRNYARVASRRKAAAPRRAHSHYEKVSRELSEAEKALAAALTRLAEIRTAISELDDEHSRLTEQRQALQDSEAMNAARELDSARKMADKAADTAGRVEQDRERAEQSALQRVTQFESAERDMENALAEMSRKRSAAVDAANRAAINDSHGRVIDAELGEAAGLDELRAAALRLVARQHTSIKHVRGLIDWVDTAHRALVSTRQRIAELDSEAAELAEARGGAEEGVRDEAGRLAVAAREHVGAATELALSNLDSVLDELDAWAGTLDGESPLVLAARLRGNEISDRLGRDDAAAEANETRIRELLAEFEAEVARLESGDTENPPPPYTRDPAGREAREGAPLWQLVDFAPDVAAEQRAGLEAALEASGILDAWVTPSGELLDPDTNDVVVDVAEPAPGAALTRVLRPAVNADDQRARSVGKKVITRILGAVGYGGADGHHTWVGDDGRYRIGVLAGGWHKDRAQYIGAGARDQERQRRLIQLRAEIDSCKAQLAEVEEQRRIVRVRGATLAAELDSLPGDGALRGAHQTLSTIVQRQRHLQTTRATADTAASAETAAYRDADAELIRDAADCELPTNRAALDEITDALTEYRLATAELWHAMSMIRRSEVHAHEARTELERAQERHAELTELAAGERREAIGAEQRLVTLRESVGAEVAELERALETVDRNIKANRSGHSDESGELGRVQHAHGVAEGERNRLVVEVEGTKADRDGATESLRRFAQTGLLSVALEHTEVPDPSEPWAPNPAVQLARAIESELEAVADDDKVWDRLQRRITEEHKTLGDVLGRQGNSTSAQLQEEGIVVDVLFRGKPATVPELTETLAAEVTDRSRLLTEREREILENHLVSEVASTLQELIFAAEHQVAQMNSELDVRPTSTGMRLRLYWEPSDAAPAGAPAAQRQLRCTADAWNEADRAAVGEFLQHEIERIRTKNEGGTWLENLTEALDYRQWNRFVIKRQQNGQWKSATGPASGGERVLAASVPLFAAASAHYASAGNPHAPRLVTLDEAFAGVDDNARAKYLGLLAAFDLDVVMTSEREWGCYPEVPGLAIAHLARTDDVAAVLVTNWEWDGRARTEVARPARALAALQTGDDGGRSQDGLWSADTISAD